MTKFTISVYYFFKKHKPAFYIILLSTTLIFTFFSLKVNFEEDISTLLPSTEKDGAESIVFSNLKVKDKIFILFTSPDNKVTTDDLIYICDDFVKELLDKDSSLNSINNILYEIDEDLFTNAIDFLYGNVPVFLDTFDYSALDSLFDKENIIRQMEENYFSLISPAGMAFKDIIIKDPVALRNIFFSGLGKIANGTEGNYTLYNNHMIAKDSSFVIAFLSPNFKSFDSKQGINLSSMIESEIKYFQDKNPDIEILYHGAPVQSVYNSRQIKKDLLLTISISLILIFIILLICFRNKSNLLYLIIPVVYGVLFSLAVIYLIKGSMSLMAMGIGAIVMGVAFSYCLHIITHYKYVNDPVKVLKDQTVPVILSALTTIGAFMGLLLTKSELLQDFGLFASLGLVGTTVFCILFLPQFFNTKTNKKSDKAFAVLEKANSFPFEKQKWLIITIVVVSVVCIVASGNVKFDSNLQNIGYHDNRVVRSQEMLSGNKNGKIRTVYFAASSNDLDTALIYGKELTEKLDILIENKLIKGYSVPSSLFIPLKEQESRIQKWNEYWNDEKIAYVKNEISEAGNKYKFTPDTFEPFFEILNNSYEPVSLYNAGILPDAILDNIIEHMDNKYLVFIPVQMDKSLLSEVGDIIVSDNPGFIVVDPMYYTNDMAKMIHDDFDLTVTMSSLFVFIVLLISFRSIVLSILAFLPMGLSWYIVLGVMAITGMEFNLINIVISTFVFGIGVDYSIFIMDGLLATYRRKEPLLVYHKTAIFFSALILIIVISSLLFAVHPAISSIGLSTLIGMSATLLIAYSLQPFLFSLLITKRAECGKAPIAINTLFVSRRNETPVRGIKNNYLYKGNDIESRLRKELKKSDNYSLITGVVKDKKDLFDYGCSFGFCSYWSLLTNNQIKVTGFDTDSNALILAADCYKKNDHIRFTSDINVMDCNYDVVILNSNVISSKEKLLKLINNAESVIVRREYLDIYSELLDHARLTGKRSDDVFILYS